MTSYLISHSGILGKLGHVEMSYPIIFSFYHIVEEAEFRRGMHLCLTRPSCNPPSRTSSYSSVLHNAILAAACEFCNDMRASDAMVYESLLKTAQRELLIEGDRPTLSTVQGAILIGNCLTCASKHGLAYLYTGIAIRMCHTRQLISSG